MGLGIPNQIYYTMEGQKIIHKLNNKEKQKNKGFEVQIWSLLELTSNLKFFWGLCTHSKCF